MRRPSPGQLWTRLLEPHLVPPNSFVPELSPGHPDLMSLYWRTPQAALSCAGSRSRSISKRRVPLPASLGRQIHEVPHRREQVDAALLDARPHSRMRGVEVPDDVVGVFRENGDGRILAAVGVFAAKIVFESIRTRAEQTNFVPTACACVSVISQVADGA
jgi:hypothetical protein